MKIVRFGLSIISVLMLLFPIVGYSAQISVEALSQNALKLNWSANTNIVNISYKLTSSSSWIQLKPTGSTPVTGSYDSNGFQGVVSPGNGTEILADGEYVFRLMECRVLASAPTSSGDPKLWCGANQQAYGSVYNGAVVQSAPIVLPYHYSMEFNNSVPALPALGSNDLVVQTLNQFGKIRVAWRGADTVGAFVELAYSELSSTDWVSIPYSASGFKSVTVNIPGTSSTETAIALSGVAEMVLPQSGRYEFRMRTCYYVAPQNAAPVRTCSNYVSSSPSAISAEALNLTNLPPIITINAPQANTSVVVGKPVIVKVLATDPSIAGILNGSSQISKVEFSLNAPPTQITNKVATVTAATNGYYQYTFTPTSEGDIYIVAEATDTAGASAKAVSSIRVIPAAVTLSQPNNTLPINFSRYAIYYGNVDSDDQDLRDIYFHGLPLTIILAGDIPTPITLPAPPGFVFLGKEGGLYQPASEWDMTDAAIKACATCILAEEGIDYVIGDTDADGNPDILVKGEDEYHSSLLVSGTEGAELPQILLEILNTGHTRKPGQAMSQIPYFTGNLSSSSVKITNGQIQVEGVNFTLAALQQVTPTAGATLATDQNIQAPPAASLPTPTLAPYELAEMDTLNSLGGEFRVSEAGAATYSIPIALPAGTAGVAPDLSLNYSSQAGVSNMGLGWSLSAGSSISRCRQTMQVDQQALPIKFSSSDRFCLDGQRLLLTSSGNYGDIGAVYKPEIDNGVIVTSIGGIAGHPDYFKVTAKDGSLSILGGAGAHASEQVGTDDLGASQTNRIMSWNISEFRDSLGRLDELGSINKIVYTYESSKDYFRLKSISYGYGSGTIADVEISFNYGTRRQSTPYWVAGSRFADNSLLKSILIKDRGETVNEYRISYNFNIYESGADKTDRVSNIRTCLGEQCSRPLALEWGFASPWAASAGNGKVRNYTGNIFGTSAQNADKNGFPRERVTLASGAPGSEWSVNSRSIIGGSPNSWYISHAESDVDGDGRSDLLVLQGQKYSSTSKSFTLDVMSQTSSGLKAGVYVASFSGDPEATDGREVPQLQPVDLNSDGRMDLAVYVPKEKKWRTYFSKPTAGQWNLQEVKDFIPSVINDANSPVDNLRFADVNSDGLADAIYTKNNTLYVHYLLRKSAASTEMELAISRSAQAFAFSATPNIQAPAALFDTYNFGGAYDFNEDGRVDILGVNMSVISTVKPTTTVGYVSTTPNECKYNLSFKTFIANTGNSFVAGSEIPAATGAVVLNQVINADPDVHTAPIYVIAKCDKEEFRRRLIGPYLSDINGDGLVDLVWAFSSPKNTVSSDIKKDPENVFKSISYRLGNIGNTFGAEKQLPLTVEGVGLELMDVDSDGDTDLLISGKDDARWISKWTTQTNDSALGFGATSTHLTASKGRQTRYSDINGDGYLDKSEIVANALTVTLGVPSSNNQVIRFQTGMGAVTSVAYEPLRDSGRYSKLEGIVQVQTGTQVICAPVAATDGSGCVVAGSQPILATNSEAFYTQINDPFAGVDNITNLGIAKNIPAMEIISTMPVVTRVASSAPTPANQNALAAVDYSYAGLKVQAGGRGLLGFNKLTTTDIQTGIRTETEYRQDWPFAGTPIKTTVKTRQGVVIKQSENKMGIYGIDANNIAAKRTLAATGTAKLGPLVTYTNVVKDITYDVPDSLLTNPGSTNTATTIAQVKLSEVVTTTTVDGFGNVKTLDVETFGSKIVNDLGVNDSTWASLRKQTTTNVYYPGDGERLARLQTSTVVTKGLSTTKTRTARFTYYGFDSGYCSNNRLAGLLCSEQITVSDLGNSEAPAVTVHYYDDFGNKIYSKTDVRVSPMVQFDSKGRFAQATYDVYRRESGAGGSAPGWYSAPTNAVTVKTSEVLLRDKFGNAILSRSALDGNNWIYSVQAATPMGTLYFKGDSTGAYEETKLLRSQVTTANWCPFGTSYLSISTKAGGARAAQCFDKVGRTVGGYAIGFAGEAIRQRKDYDTLGRVVRAYEPAKNAAPTDYASTTYDVLGRPILVTHAFNITSTNGVESASKATTQFTYSGLTTTTTVSGYSDGASRAKLEARNALGQLVKVTELGAEPRSITYTYDELGNLTKTRDPVGNSVSIFYNGLGQKIKLDDPDKGIWNYYYNAYGDQYKQVDANGTTSTTQFDFKGRKIRQEVKATLANYDSYIVSWNYDLAINGLGKMSREEKTNLSGVVEFTRQMSFDDFGRPSITTTTFVGKSAANDSHYQKVTYDEYGRVFQSFDAARSGAQFTYNGVQNHYNEYGYMDRVDDAANSGSAYFYKVKGMDARGNVTEMLYASGEQVNYVYHPKTGFLTEIKRTLGADFKSYSATWDHFGNLVSRSHGLLGTKVETFKYDQFNRLTSNTLDSKTVTVKYNAIDNITNKLDLEADALYTYHATKKHAVANVGNRSYTYDSNGNMTSELAGSVVRKKFTYTGNDLAKKIEVIGTNAHTSEFFYDSSNSRYKRIDKDAAGKVTTTLYLGSVEKIYYADGTEEWRREIGGVTQVTHKVTAGKADVGTKRFLHKDHLGSLVAITSSTGVVEQRMAFDPWGARRTITNNEWQSTSMAPTGILASYAKTAKPITNRGYTGHEMLDEVGIIHMNGRIYDAYLGRFLQADPLIQEPTMVGSLNRYSYVMNNPLNAVDPSGFSWLSKVFKNVGQFITGGIANTDWFKDGFRSVAKMLGSDVTSFLVGIGSFFCGPAAPVCVAIGTYNTARAFGASSSAAFRSAAIAGGTALAFQQVGRGFKGDAGTALAKNGPLHILSHATIGGVSSVLQGGKFGHGFVSAGFTKLITPSIAGIRGLPIGDVSVAQAAIAGLVGGTVSQATGGKFANGFITASFGNIFNQQMSAAQEKRLYKPGTGGISLNINLGVGGGLTDGLSLVWDRSGNIGLQMVSGPGLASLGASLMINFEGTNAADIFDLEGRGGQGGVSAGEFLIGEIGLSQGNGYEGVYWGVGIGGGSPVGASIFTTQTYTLYDFNFYDAWDYITGVFD